MLLRPRDEPGLWPSLFAECQRSAFHLEQRDTYAVPEEEERIRRYLSGEEAVPAPSREWPDLIADARSRGVTVSRVRVVTVPHTDYHRWLLSVTDVRVNDGEDIRYLPRHLAGEVPSDDWWLMDAERVAYNLVNGEGRPAGLAVTTDPRIAAYCEEVRQRLWKLAIPYADYVGSEFAKQ
ncbi:Uncharacterised protein [Nocardia otitidiscaviarum]|uniref:DUF6879 domain-containing protein n=1 Tax=Nocardia otitidiscaviarum TaxID=1823 RepID=A0A378YDL7_9NOCA|nr:Uncharacterised protein [Nocardia otitidiscaviarum]